MTLKKKVRESVVAVKESPRALLGLNAPEVEKWLSERIRQGVEDLLNGLLQEEVEQFVGAGKYERTGNRRGYRSGSYERQYQTRVGEALPQVAAAEVLVDRLADDRPEEPVAIFVALGVELLRRRSSPPLGAPQRRETKRELKGVPNFDHAGLRQGCNQGTDPAPGNSLQVIEVHGALAGHSIVGSQHDFGRNVAYDGSHRCNRDFSEEFKRGIARQDQHRAAFVWRVEAVPADLAAPHGSPQTCSPSHAENSFSPTGMPR